MLFGVLGPKQRIRPIAAETNDAEPIVLGRLPRPKLGAVCGVLDVPAQELEGIVELVDSCDLKPPVLKCAETERLGREMIEAHFGKMN